MKWIKSQSGSDLYRLGSVNSIMKDCMKINIICGNENAYTVAVYFSIEECADVFDSLERFIKFSNEEGIQIFTFPDADIYYGLRNMDVAVICKDEKTLKTLRKNGVNSIYDIIPKDDRDRKTFDGGWKRVICGISSETMSELIKKAEQFAIKYQKFHLTI